MKRFDTYIAEEKGTVELYELLKRRNLNEQDADEETSDINIIVLTNRNLENDSALYHTAKTISDVCQKRKIPYYTLFAENAHIVKNEDGTATVHNWDDKKGFLIDPEKTIAINRGSVARRFSTLNLISQLEKLGIYTLNNRMAIETCSDKYRTILKLGSAAIPSPRTALVQDIDTLPFALEQLDNKFPLVVKTLTGSKGIGVFFGESPRSLKSILQTIWKINEEQELILQEHIESPFDVRAHVLGDEVIAAMKRHKIKDDFRSNYSQGSKVESFKITDEQAKICIKASKVVGTQWAGVDFILNSKGEPFVIEVNSSPGTAGIEKATHGKIVEQVIDFASDKKNWRKVANEVGFKEVVEILGIPLKAKFDTGNAALCVIHADKHKIDEKKKMVTWWHDGKKFSHKYKEIRDVRVGGLRDYTEQRPVIELDVTFDGVIYKEVDFTIADRSKRMPVLLNRKFIKKTNSAVNPAKAYVVTSPVELEGE